MPDQDLPPGYSASDVVDLPPGYKASDVVQKPSLSTVTAGAQATPKSALPPGLTQQAIDDYSNRFLQPGHPSYDVYQQMIHSAPSEWDAQLKGMSPGGSAILRHLATQYQKPQSAKKLVLRNQQEIAGEQTPERQFNQAYSPKGMSGNPMDYVGFLPGMLSSAIAGGMRDVGQPTFMQSPSIQNAPDVLLNRALGPGTAEAVHQDASFGGRFAGGVLGALDPANALYAPIGGKAALALLGAPTAVQVAKDVAQGNLGGAAGGALAFLAPLAAGHGVAKLRAKGTMETPLSAPTTEPAAPLTSPNLSPETPQAPLPQHTLETYETPTVQRPREGQKMLPPGGQPEHTFIVDSQGNVTVQKPNIDRVGPVQVSEGQPTPAQAFRVTHWIGSEPVMKTDAGFVNGRGEPVQLGPNQRAVPNGGYSPSPARTVEPTPADAQTPIERASTPAPTEPQPAPTTKPVTADDVLGAIGDKPVNTDDVVAKTGGSAKDVNTQLGLLAVSGKIKAMPGGRYVRAETGIPETVAEVPDPQQMAGQFTRQFEDGLDKINPEFDHPTEEKQARNEQRSLTDEIIRIHQRLNDAAWNAIGKPENSSVGRMAPAEVRNVFLKYAGEKPADGNAAWDLRRNVLEGLYKTLQSEQDAILQRMQDRIAEKQGGTGNAVQEPQAGTVLQRQPEETGGGGGGRGRVEQGVQGQETAPQGQGQEARQVGPQKGDILQTKTGSQFKVIGPDPAKPGNIILESQQGQGKKSAPQSAIDAMTNTSRLDQALEKNAQAIKDIGKGRAGSGIEVAAELSARLVYHGALLLTKGVTSFAKWSAAMIKEFGEGIKPGLQSLWDQAHDHLAQNGGVPQEPSDPMADRIRQTVQKTAQERLVNNEANVRNILTKEQEKKPANLHDIVTGITRNFKLSGGAIFPKLLGVSATNVPVEALADAFGFPVGKIKYGGRSLANISGREGAYPLEGVGTGFRQAYVPGAAKAGTKLSGPQPKEANVPALQNLKDVLKYGQSEIATRAGKSVKTGEFGGIVGRLHGAEKTLGIETPEYYRSLEIRLKRLAAQGENVKDPVVQAKAKNGAAIDAQNAILRGDNKGSKQLNDLFSNVQKSESAGIRAAGTLAETQVPVRNVAANFLGKLFQSTGAGILEGSGRLTHAMLTKAEMTPEMASKIISAYKYGGLGLVMATLAYYEPKAIQFAGMYSKDGDYGSDDAGKRGPMDVSVFGKRVPKVWVHNPAIYAGQLWATVFREGRKYGWGGAAGSATKGLMEQVPGAESVNDIVGSTLEPGTGGEKLGRALGKATAGNIIPQAVQSVARATDTATGRKPQGYSDELKMGVPYLRGQVPTAAALKERKKMEKEFGVPKFKPLSFKE